MFRNYTKTLDSKHVFNKTVVQLHWILAKGVPSTTSSICFYHRTVSSQAHTSPFGPPLNSSSGRCVCLCLPLQQAFTFLIHLQPLVVDWGLHPSDLFGPSYGEDVLEALFRHCILNRRKMCSLFFSNLVE